MQDQGLRRLCNPCKVNHLVFLDYKVKVRDNLTSRLSSQINLIVLSNLDELLLKVLLKFKIQNCLLPKTIDTRSFVKKKREGEKLTLPKRIAYVLMTT